MNRRVLTIAALMAILALVLSTSIIGATDIHEIPTPQTIDPEAGLVIVQVDREGPAAEGGVVRGDILQAIDGQEINSQLDLRQALREREAGDEIALTILHGDDLRTIPVTLGERGEQAYLGLVPFAGPGRILEMSELLEDLEPASGALILEVVEDSPAEQAGLEAGTIITAVDDLKLDGEANLAEVIADYEPGDTVTLTISGLEADEEATQVEVTLAEHPDREGVAFLGVSYRTMAPGRILEEGLGEFDPEDLPFDAMPFQRQFRFQAPTAGILVREVAADSPAEAAGLQARDVITAVDGEAVESPQDVIDSVNAREPGDVLTLTAERPGQEEALEIEVSLGSRPDDADEAYLGVSLGGFFMHMERQVLPNDGQEDVLPFSPQGNMPFPFQLPFELEDLPFDLDQLPFDLDELLMPNQPDQLQDGPILQPGQSL